MSQEARFQYAMQHEPRLTGCLLREPDIFFEIAEVVSAEDFADEECRAVFLATKALLDAGEPANAATIYSKTAGAAERDHLVYWLQLCATATTALEHAKGIRRESVRRQAANIGNKLWYETSSEHSDPTDAILEAIRALEDVESKSPSQPILSPLDAAVQFSEHIEKVANGGTPYIKTGMETLDNMLGGGMLNSGFYVLAARPGVGKTALALKICDDVASTGKRVLFITLEMDSNQIMARRVARETGIGSSKILMEKLTDEEYEKVTDSLNMLSKRQFSTNWKESASVDDISQMARKIKNLDLLCIDYLGLIHMDTRRGRYEAVTDVSNKLKALARKLQIPILCLAQLNRAPEGRKDTRPMLSDLRDSGAIEQDADAVMFLHPMAAEDENRKPWEPTYVELILAKNRHAGTGTIPLAFYPAVMRYKMAKYD